MLTEAKLRRICVPANTGTLLLQDLPKTYQWIDILRTTVKHLPNPSQIMGLAFCPGAIFTGPAGNGRHSHANALANNLTAKGDYKNVVGIHGSDLDFEDSDDFYSILDYLEKLVTCNGHTVLMLDQPELSKHSLRFQNQLFRLQQSLRKEEKNLFLIVITKTADDVASSLLSTFPRYHCPKPNTAAVSAFVDNMLKNPVPIKLQEVKKADIIKALKDCSWKQLADLHTQLLRMLVFQYIQNWKSYTNKGYSEKEVYEAGLIELPCETVKNILASVAVQNPQPSAPIVQTVAAMGTIPTISTQTIPGTTLDDGIVIDDAISTMIQESDAPVDAFVDFIDDIPSNSTDDE